MLGARNIKDLDYIQLTKKYWRRCAVLLLLGKSKPVSTH